MKKKFLLLLVAIATCCITASAADSYEINVAGVEVTPNNCNYITGGGIESGYGVYDKSSNTLTLHGVSINVNGLNNFGIHNRKCDNLKIVFSGNCYVIAADNAMKLERSTTISVASGNKATLYSNNRIVVNLKSYNYYFTGSGSINVWADDSGYESIKGEGTSSTKVYFQGIKVSASSEQRSALSSFAAYFQSGSDMTITGNGSNASVSDVSMSFSGKETVLEPYGAYYSNNSIYSSSGSQIKSGTIRISDDYVAIINSSNFPDANFRSFMLGQYSKGYITSTDVDLTTSMSPSGKSISNLTGIGYFTKLTTLNCSSNNLSSLDLSAQTNLKTLNASSNQLTSINLPASLETLNLSNNTKFTTFNWCYKNALKIVDFSNCTGVKTVSLYNNSAMTSLSMSNCTALTTLNCYTSALTYLNVSGCSALTTLNCYSNALTSLNVSGCSALTTLNCYSNQLTSLGTLPTSLQTIDCSSNKFSGTFSLTGRSALKSLNISNNTNLTALDCQNNQLTSLNVTGCTALTSLNCSMNKFSGTFSLTGRSALKTLNISYNTSLTTLNCYSNALTSLNVSGCSALTTLNCYSNQLTSLGTELGTLPTSLQTIDCSSNKFSGTFSLTGRSALKTLNISYNTSLTTLNCYSNALTSLNVSGCSALTTLNCYKNQLTSLGTLPTSLKTIDCSSNKFSGTFSLTGRSALKSLDISYNTDLTALDCQNNQLTSLNVTGCTALTSLNCSSNKLSRTFTLTNRSALKTLNISNNPNLTTLNCSENGLTNFNVSGCSALTSLDCSRNQLTSLDLSGLSSLKELYCYYNEMTSLSNVPNSIEIIECQNNKFTGLTMSNKPALKILLCNNNTSMTALYAQNNAISNLGVTGCSALKILYCNGNKLSSLSLDRCSALNEFTIARNQISGSYMTSLINTLRSIPTSEEEGIFMVYNKDQESEEGNAITDDQIESARAKRWIPKKFVNNEWVWATIKGDVNGDGVCNAADITALYNWILNGDKTSLKNGYQNDDNVINAGDITTVYNIILGN